ncbi:unnamed protein product [Amoebophrya sp. A25]|nr:unnamed protein product [Amoebophrya sp. A25]|eukprot:GSA25T00003343001.1
MLFHNTANNPVEDKDLFQKTFNHCEEDVGKKTAKVQLGFNTRCENYNQLQKVRYKTCNRQHKDKEESVKHRLLFCNLHSCYREINADVGSCTIPKVDVALDEAAPHAHFLTNF